MEQQITEKLAQLANLKDATDILRMDKQAQIETVLTPEIKMQLDSIDIEFAEMEEAAQANIKALEADIKADVLAHGASVKGERMRAQWSKPRVTWDSKALNGYAAAHPEILTLRKVGKPSVSLRVVK